MKRHAWQARLGLMCAALMTLTLLLPLAARAGGVQDMTPYLTGSRLMKQASPVADGDLLALSCATGDPAPPIGLIFGLCLAALVLLAGGVWMVARRRKK